MFVILVYDFEESRVGKAHKICKKYLTWVQNSVFEGELTETLLRMLLDELGKIMVKDRDSVIVYKFASRNYYERKVIGVKKGSADNFIL